MHYMCCPEHICLNILAGMTVYILSTRKCSTFPETFLDHHCFLAVVFNRTELKVTEGTYYSPFVKLSWCHDLLFMWVTQVCLSC
jgi:hypothetical protein